MSRRVVPRRSCRRTRGRVCPGYAGSFGGGGTSHRFLVSTRIIQLSHGVLAWTPPTDRWVPIPNSRIRPDQLASRGLGLTAGSATACWVRRSSASPDLRPPTHPASTPARVCGFSDSLRLLPAGARTLAAIRRRGGAHRCRYSTSGGGGLFLTTPDRPRSLRRSDVASSLKSSVLSKPPDPALVGKSVPAATPRRTNKFTFQPGVGFDGDPARIRESSSLTWWRTKSASAVLLRT